jgi:S1-C subfamily serine protease
MKKYMLLLLVGITLILFSIACVASPFLSNGNSQLEQNEIIIPDTSGQSSLPLFPDIVSQEETLTAIYEDVSRGVVFIRVLTRFGEGLGSGFVYDDEGHIITNFHVIEGIQDLEINFPSGKKVRGEVLGIDLDSDLAVIKVDVPPEHLYPLVLGDSESIKVGQTVVAIGNPFGLRGTMTVGIISAVGRTLDSMRIAPGGSYFEAGDLIQTDTAINPGNSGGPLINLNGEVVGINRAIRTENFSAGGDPLNSGIGFAISINIAKRVVPSIIAEGKYDYPYLGISGMEEISLLEQEALGLSRSTGVYITDITPDSPAARAGLMKGRDPSPIAGLFANGDLIIAMDDRPVRTFAEMLNYIINHKSPGDMVKVTILRNGQEMEVDLILGSRP